MSCLAIRQAYLAPLAKHHLMKSANARFRQTAHDRSCVGLDDRDRSATQEAA
jgi:hypothetical protein